jgi:hypothetical protein
VRMDLPKRSSGREDQAPAGCWSMNKMRPGHRMRFDRIVASTIPGMTPIRGADAVIGPRGRREL